VHPGTYNGNAFSTAAARATLNILARGDAYESIERAGGRLMGGFSGLLESRGIPSVVQGVPASFNVHIGIDRPISSMADTAAVDSAAVGRLTLALLARGIRAIPGGHWYLSAAHTDELVDETLNAFEDALRDIA
jgi:glutamate-1-semialdehyde 2,1-aminomutase